MKVKKIFLWGFVWFAGCFWGVMTTVMLRQEHVMGRSSTYVYTLPEAITWGAIVALAIVGLFRLLTPDNN